MTAPARTTSGETRLTYYQQLRDPRWIEFATKLKIEADWKCQHCGKKQGEVELSIHHTFYISGLMMWEHPRCVLLVLCDPHHKERQAIEQQIYVNIADIMRDKTNEELLAQPLHAFFTGDFTFSKNTLAQ